MILQENIQKKAEEYGELASVFLEGAKFALENQWISVKDDLPYNHEELLYQKEIIEESVTKDVFVTNEDGDIWDDYMVYENGKWRWNDFEPAYWMVAPKLLKNRR